MGKFIRTVRKDDTFTITEQSDGFWLWDETRQMNLGLKQKSPEEAYRKAILYYQHRLLQVEEEFKSLRDAADVFISAARPDTVDF